MEENNVLTYDHFGKQYKFSDLEESVYSGMDNYASLLGNGKYNSEFRDAVINIMTGLKDKSIKFQNGRFHDTKGRYTNHKNRKKDVYGWAAQYIFGNMGQSGVYESPENSKSKWENNSLSKAFINDVFGTGGVNPNYFIEQDQPDTSGVRGTTVRTKMVTDWLDKINNDYFSKYSLSDSDIATQISAAQEASQKLKENGFDPGDYLYLARALPGIDWEKLFANSLIQNTQKSDQTSQTGNSTIATQQPTLSREDFDNWFNETYPSVEDSTFSTDTSSLRYGKWTRNQIINVIKNADTDTLYNYFIAAVNNPNYNFGRDPLFKSAIGKTTPLIPSSLVVQAALTALIKRNGWQPDESGEYILPFTKNGSGYIYNPNNNQVRSTSIKNLKSFQKKLYNKYYKARTGQDATDNDDYTKFFTTYKKHGGILKAEGGTSVSNIYAGGNNPDIGYNTYLNNIFMDDAVINQMDAMFNGNFNEYGNFIKKNIETRYKAGINNFQNQQTVTSNPEVLKFNKGYQNGGNTFNYVLFGNSDDDYNNRQNGIAYKYANFIRPVKPLGTGDRYNSDPNEAYSDALGGLNTYTRVASLTNKDQTDFGKWGKYWKSKGATGAYYQIAEGDKSGYGQWIPTNDTSIVGYRAFDPTSNAVSIASSIPQEQFTQPNNINKRMSDINQQALQSVENVNKNTGTDIFGTNLGTKDKLRTYGFWKELVPDLIDAGRLAASIHTNNKIANILSQAIKPNLEQTYELYSPVTGAFSQMQYMNGLAANTERQASKAFTSDASLQLAGNLEAGRQARDLRLQGFLADDKEIKRTKEEALARQEDNKKRRTETANENMASINDTNYQKAEVEANRRYKNWEGADNFAKQFVTRMRAKNAEDKENIEAVLSSLSTKTYKDVAGQYNNKYKLKYPEKTEEQILSDPKYLKGISNLRDRYNYEQYNIMLGRYPKYLLDQKPKTYDELLLFSKRGGKLNVMNMINKIMNE